MKNYCVVYKVSGIHYRYRCTANTTKEAKKMCREYMGCTAKDIVEAYEE